MSDGRRLIRRGLAPLAGFVAAELDQGPASASLLAWAPSHVAHELVQATIRASVRVAAGEPTGPIVSVVVASLAKRVIWSMTMIKLEAGLVGVALVGLVGSGAWFAALDGAQARAQLKTIPKVAQPAKTVNAGVSAKSYCSLPGQHTVVSFVEDGSRVKKGDVVCELDSSALADQLVDQHIAMLSAKANFREGKANQGIESCGSEISQRRTGKDGDLGVDAVESKKA